MNPFSFSYICLVIFISCTCTAVLMGHRQPVGNVYVTLDGLRIVSCSSDRVEIVWEIKTGQCLSTKLIEDRNQSQIKEMDDSINSELGMQMIELSSQNRQNQQNFINRNKRKQRMQKKQQKQQKQQKQHPTVSIKPCPVSTKPCPMSTKPCLYFIKFNRCGYGDECRFLHDKQ